MADSEAKQAANAEEGAYQARRRSRELQRRRQNKAEWLAYYQRLHLVHKSRADEFARRIAELQREEEE